MQQLIEFVTNHWELFLALVVIVALLLRSFLAESGGKDSVDPMGATELINHKDAVVIDVRPEAEFRDGHIINAVQVPMNQLGSQLDRLAKFKKRPVIVSCRSGSQSAAACRTLRKEGFEEVYNLKGGILAWKNANLPVTRKSK
jgi:rhodanese-related sulfurtransferase